MAQPEPPHPCGCSSVAERELPNLGAEGSIPFTRATKSPADLGDPFAVAVHGVRLKLESWVAGSTPARTPPSECGPVGRAPGSRRSQVRDLPFRPDPGSSVGKSSSLLMRRSKVQVLPWVLRGVPVWSPGHPEPDSAPAVAPLVKPVSFNGRTVEFGSTDWGSIP